MLVEFLLKNSSVLPRVPWYLHPYTFILPRSIIKSIITKNKEYGTNINLTRDGCPPILTDWARRALLECNQNIKDNTEGAAKIHSGKVVLVHKITLSQQFTELGFMEE